MSTTVRRTAVALVAWAIGAAFSVSIGLLALLQINHRLDTGPARPPAPRNAPAPSAGNAGAPSLQTARPASAATGPVTPPATSPGQRTGGAGPTPATAQVVSSIGGSAVARCDGDSAYLLSWSPRPGYLIGPVDRGPAPVAQVAFQSSGGTVRLSVRCFGGVPQPFQPGNPPPGGPMPSRPPTAPFPGGGPGFGPPSGWPGPGR